MEKLNKILCTICMRENSKGVPGKNLSSINGKPLMAYTIEQALESKLFKHIIFFRLQKYSLKLYLQ